MSNDYFDFRTLALPPNVPGAKARAGEINRVFDAIEAAFDLLPPPGLLELGVSTLGTESGSGNSYVVTMPTTRVSNDEGDEVVFRATHSNTGAATLQVDAISAVALRRFNGDALVTGDIVTGRFYAARYDATNSRFAIVWPAQVTTVSGSIAYAAPTTSVALTALEGSAITVLRSDAQLALSQAIAPTWTGAHTFTALGTAVTAPSILVSNARPGISLNETDGAANNRLWGIEAQSEQLRLFAATDAGVATNFMTVDRTAGTVDSIAFAATNWTFNGGQIPTGFANPTASVGLSAVNGSATTAMRSDGAPALSQSIVPTMTGQWTFTNQSANIGSVVVANTAPTYGWNETDAGSDAKRWRLFAAGGIWTLATLTDADAAGSTALTVARSGTTISTIALSATNITANGTEVLRTGNAFANPTGTIGLSAVNGSAVTALRSDGAPALSQAIAPTWTAQHTFSQVTNAAAAFVGSNSNSAGVRVFIGNTSPAADNRYWGMRVNENGDFRMGVWSDANFPTGSETANFLVVERTGTTVSSVSFPVDIGSIGGDFRVGAVNDAAGGQSLSQFRSAVSGSIAISARNVTSGAFTFTVINEATSGDNSFISFRTESGAGTARGSITYNRAGGLVAYNTSCRESNKTNIRTSDPALPLLAQIPIVAFDWRNSSAKLPYFVTYERLENLAPWACQNDGVDVSKLVPLTIKALQELAERVAALESPALRGEKLG